MTVSHVPIDANELVSATWMEMLCQTLVEAKEYEHSSATGASMANRNWWCSLLSVLFLVAGAGSVRAIELGEMVAKNGERRVFRKMEDPVFKFLRTQGVITSEESLKASAQTGKNWIEPADAVLIRRRNMEWSRYAKTAMHLPDWVDLGLENRT